MKTFINLFFAIAALSLFTFNNSNSQVTVSGALVGNGSYTTLSAAFTAINGGAQTSATIQIAITGNTTEPAAGAVLNNGAWTRLVIIPNGIRTISGAVNPGTPLIDFNGADKVEIFGVNSGGISLTISNTTVSSTSGTSTIRFQTDATNNKIDKCIILGSSNMAANVNGGNIWFGSNSSSTGNDNNVISNCDIGPAGSNLPSKGVYFSGTTTTTALNNSGDTILNCNIFNYFRDSTTSAGIYIGTGSTNTIMKGNQFYQTSARTQLTGNQHSGIWIANPTGDNFLISGNTIGFASSSGTGTYTFNGVAASRLIPVYFSSGTTTASYIESNYVSGISMSGPITGTGVNTSLTGIQVAAGLVNIGTLFGNTIGSITDTGSIRFTSSSASNTDICGIYLGGSGNYSLSYNAVGGITASNSGTGSCIIYLYRASTTSSNTVAFQNNLAGGYIANSINNKSSGVNTKTAGFYIDNPSATITGNTVQNLTSAGGTETNSQSSVSGITIVTGSANHVVSQNTIYNLKNTNGSSASVINGIFFNAANGTISRNFIHTLIISGNNSTASGIHVNGGTSTFQNNMVQLGIDTSGTGVNSGAAVNGINETGGNNNFYFNSVYVGGSPTSGTANTFAFSSTVTGVPRIFQNNIFYNARSNNGSTGKHYSVRVGGTVPNPSGLTINNNVYLANGSGGIFGLYNGSDVTNLSAWKSAVGQDANSFESDPKYINPAGTYLSTNLHINPSVPTVVEGTGFNIAAITDDYDGQTRSTLTPVDIGADAGNFIVGAIVNVAGAVSGNGIYTTLSDAFNAINLSAQTSSNIVITINGDVSESTSGAVLNAGTWSTLKIQPAGGASRSISANVNAGSTLIDLNGADNVTIDGLNTGGNTLTISNTSTSSASGTSTIKFQTDASNNTITRCSILGSSTMAAGTAGGNVYIADGAISTGNDNNLISFCDIGPAGLNLPSQAVLILGSNGVNAQLQNSGDTVRNCNVFNYFNAAFQSAGVYIATDCREIFVLDNKFYQTALRTQVTGSQHSAIWLRNTGVFPTGSFTISGNTIGSASSSGTGTYTISGVSQTKVFPIYINKDVSGNVSIQGNTITKMSVSGNVSGNAFGALYIQRGNVYVGTETGNIIGSMSDTGSISYESSSSSNSDIYGMYVADVQQSSYLNNNIIGGITASNTSSGRCQLYCVRGAVGSGSRIYLENNIIGGTPANSINNKSTGSGTRTFGYSGAQAGHTVTNNIIRNLTSAGGTGTSAVASLVGITITGSVLNSIISQNTIYNLKNSNTLSVSQINGIYFDGAFFTHTVSGNFIHTLIVSGSNSSLYGIQTKDGQITFQNNMIQLGLDTNGNGVNIGAAMYGIRELSGTNNFYFNSVYIGGSPTAGSNNTFAFSSAVTSGTRNFRNNIFYNARSNNGSTGKNYAVTAGGTAPNPSGLTINNNVYFADGSGGVFGLFNGSDVSNLASWKTAVGQDANSYESNPQYINPNGSASSVDLHISPSIATVVEGNGFDIASITDDYDGQTRSTLTPVDIGADAGDFKTINLVTVSGAVSGNGSYLTLSSAFTAINASAQTSANIIITIKDSTTEPSAGAVLNAGAWSGISITPVGNIVMTGAANAGSPLIELNGADNVTIDGLNTGGNSLTISNTNVSSTSGTSTIRFQTDATNNKITNCSILGSCTVSDTIDGGNVFFAANAVTTGNDNNVISYCNIGPAGSNLPSKCVYSKGTTSSTTLNNSADTIRNCNIYDFFSTAGNSAGVYYATGTTDFVFKDNRLYQTASRTLTTGLANIAIWINNTTGNNFTVSGNIIGYSSSAGTGSYDLIGTTNTYFNPMYMGFGNTTASNISGNIIGTTSMSGSISGTGSNTPYGAIMIYNGTCNVTGNTIGSQTDTNIINISSTSSSSMDVVGIYSLGTTSMNASNNTIGGITSSNSGTGSIVLYTVRISSGAATTTTFQNNFVGGSVSNSIYNKANTTGSRISGIYVDNSICTITANTIRNLTAVNGTGTSSSSSINGIRVGVTSPVQTVSQNNIYNLKNTNTSLDCHINGIYFTGTSSSNVVERNFIHALIINRNSADIYGIMTDGGKATYKNNFIQLGFDTSGTSITNGITLYGIRDRDGANKFYHNSVYLGGTATSGSGSSFAFISEETSESRIFRDNIFYNARSAGGSSTGKHYAVNVTGTAPNPTGLTINNNVYLATGSGGFLGLFNGSDISSLSGWQTAVGQDANSFSSDPKFINPNGSVSTANLHIDSTQQTVVESNGADVGVTNDYDGQTRSGLTPVDIGADAGDFTPLIQSATLNLKMFIEGFYNSITNTQVTDTVKVLLRNSSAPYSIVDSAKGIVSDTGNFTLTFSNASTGNYYIVLIQRNTIETWSANGVSITQGSSSSFDFSNASTQAYGSNETQVDNSPLRFAIYSGDVNQDGIVDLVDLSLVDNDAFNFVSGYVNADLDGNDFVDLSDLSIADNNAFNFVGKITP